MRNGRNRVVIGVQRDGVQQRYHEHSLRPRRIPTESACTGRALKGKATNGMKLLLSRRMCEARTQHRVVRLLPSVAGVNAQVLCILPALLTQASLVKREIVPGGTSSGADAATQYAF